MSGTKELKRRIKSIKNTKKITKAMELVAASKMRRAVATTVASRNYAVAAWQVLNAIKDLDSVDHPFLNTSDPKNVLTIVITSNRGLCGAYNTQVIKKVIGYSKQESSEVAQKYIVVGKKGSAASQRMKLDVVASFTDLPETISLRDIKPIAQFIIDEFKSGSYDHVQVAYTDFVSALAQKPRLKQLLPLEVSELRSSIESLDPHDHSIETDTREYIFEPQASELLPELVEKLITMELYQFFLESSASEQSARMMAMRNANESATEMIADLTLVFNKARQANITKEISEISAGMASVE
ncbi:ATP synthase F1 subunit gamma [Candidatus Falkowbacteria bacterium]|nr:ATP synthase F1 subunit gamma [Candidatus Falkowbacteria bacterium]